MNKLSIVIATYNSDKTLRRALNSLLKQTNKNFEVIIIDGNSKDKTVQIIKSFQDIFKQNNIPFSYISEPDTGIYNAWNKGVKMTHGNWISFLGSDDEYVDNAIETYYNVLIKLNYKEIDLVYSNVNYVNVEKHLNTIKGVWSWNVFRRRMNIAQVGSFHSKNYFETYGMFNEEYKICGDYDLLLRAENSLKAIKIEKTTAIMQSGGVSNRQVKKVFMETYYAKCSSGKLNPILAKFDYYLAFLKFYLRQIIYNIK